MKTTIENPGGDVQAKPFVDFYKRHNISPVHQDISDLRRHYERRSALYRHLGISPALVEGRSILEFGPGSGHNALFTTALRPRRYVLVDANPKGLVETEALIKSRFPDAGIHEYVDCLIEEYRSDEKFDFVFCEGVIPAQVDPAAFTRMVAAFVKPGGMVVITCVDSVSMLSETLRRLMGRMITRPGMDVQQQVETLLPIFEPHFATLGGASRSVRDWLIDAIIHPIWGSIFSITEAIDALDDDFEIFGSSPHFIRDWRWYKALHGGAERYNDVARSSYLESVANFIDYRVLIEPQGEAHSRQIIGLCEGIFEAMKKIENEGRTELLPKVGGDVGELAELFSACSPLTSRSLAEARDFFLHGAASTDLGDFRSMFGRGQSYASFIRKGLLDADRPA